MLEKLAHAHPNCDIERYISAINFNVMSDNMCVKSLELLFE